MSADLELLCYYHPEVAAISQCDVCGDYLCDECVRFHRGQYLCRTCLDITRNRLEQSRLSLAATIIAMLSALVPVATTVIVIAFRDEYVLWVPVIAGPILAVAALVVCIALKSSRLLQISLICTNSIGLAWIHILASETFEEIHFLCMGGVLLVALMFAALGNARNEGTPWQRFFTILAAAAWAGIMGILYFDIML